MGFLTFIVKCVVYLTILFYFIAYAPIFFDFNPVAYSVSLPSHLPTEGPLTRNDKLNRVERLFESEIKWPESFAVHKGIIYTGVGDGMIMKIDGTRMTNLRRTGKKCDGLWDEENCGRPLGLRFDKNGLLHVADAVYGLLTVDVETGDMKSLLPSSTIVDNHNLTLLNDLVLDEDSGIIYVTQSSVRWTLLTFICMYMEPDRSGRILAFNTKTKKTTVIANNIAFANGIEITHDKKRLLIAEMGKMQVLQYYLSGPKKGKLEPFLSYLPGEPDNIRRSKSGGYWIAFNDIRTKSTAHLGDRLSEYPLVRKVMVRFIHLAASVLNYASQYIDHHVLKEMAFEMASGRFMAEMVPANGMIIEVDNDGKIIRSLQSTKGTIAHLSQVLEHEGYLYLGSWRNHFLGRIKV